MRRTVQKTDNAPKLGERLKKMLKKLAKNVGEKQSKKQDGLIFLIKAVRTTPVHTTVHTN